MFLGHDEAIKMSHSNSHRAARQSQELGPRWFYDPARATEGDREEFRGKGGGEQGEGHFRHETHHAGQMYKMVRAGVGNSPNLDHAGVLPHQRSRAKITTAVRQTLER